MVNGRSAIETLKVRPKYFLSLPLCQFDLFVSEILNSLSLTFYSVKVTPYEMLRYVNLAILDFCTVMWQVNLS